MPMKVCMIVHNNGTRDGRVMRESHALQEAGHSVIVVGIPEAGTTNLDEQLPDGVRVVRVPCERSHTQKLLLRGTALALVALAAGYALYRFYRAMVSSAGFLGSWRIALPEGRAVLGKTILIAALLLALLYLLRSAVARIRRDARRRGREKERLRREIISEESDRPLRAAFPAIRSRIPNWLRTGCWNS